ncbi:MAG: hypothetical protein EZS28_029285 [Streblomastix strix]|uniref:Uncharacterized protein n=1 Tax=Streblomastix strix TaxID=222440 RepID=A0A5J4UXN6_9EUKA|nr:MAG: hypothetical protein EZS28_029285 [Streblomastix strix]
MRGEFNYRYQPIGGEAGDQDLDLDLSSSSELEGDPYYDVEGVSCEYGVYYGEGESGIFGDSDGLSLGESEMRFGLKGLTAKGCGCEKLFDLDVDYDCPGLT